MKLTYLKLSKSPQLSSCHHCDGAVVTLLLTPVKDSQTLYCNNDTKDCDDYDYILMLPKSITMLSSRR